MISAGKGMEEEATYKLHKGIKNVGGWKNCERRTKGKKMLKLCVKIINDKSKSDRMRKSEA